MSADTAAVMSAGRAWLAAGHKVAVATVIETWGSAPRRVGAQLMIRDDGLFEGSVSGGCVEGDVVTEAQDVLAGSGFRRLDYGVADATAWQVGLACGGQISVLVQRVDCGHFAPELLDELVAEAAGGRGLTLTTDLSTGRTEPGNDPGEGRFVQNYPPPPRLAVIGAVHIAQALVPLAALLGHAVVVIDPRTLFAADDRFAGVQLDRRWPDEALAEWRPNAASAVVALTHDPKIDDIALASALNSQAYYIAALGSRKNHAARLERLGDRFEAAQLARIHGPAGLDIGAENPAEIALSVAAQMTAAWRGKL